jgi:hypothetical protein
MMGVVALSAYTLRRCRNSLNIGRHSVATNSGLLNRQQLKRRVRATEWYWLG